MRVIVVSAEGPGNFHVLLEKHLPFEEHLQDFLKEEAKDASIPDNIEINQICLAQHPQNKNWYRAKVLRSNYERRCHEVMLIDYGNVIVVNELRIRRLDNKLLKEMPPLASKCCLENYKHFETNISTVNQRFQFLVSERKVFNIVVKGKEGAKLIVELITHDRVQNYSVTDFFKCICGILIEKKVESEVEKIKHLEIQDGEEIVVKHVESPAEFYISPVAMTSRAHTMQQQLNEFFCENSVNFTILVPGTICAMIDEEGNWHRVEILTTPYKEEMCKVKNVDSGREFWVLFEELFELPEQFYEFESYATRCCLADIEPLSDVWSVEASNFLYYHLMSCESSIKVSLTGMNKQELQVKLFVHLEGLKLNINQALVFFKLAKLSPEAGKEPIYEELIPETQNHVMSSRKKLHLIELIEDKAGFSPFAFQLKFSEFEMPVQTMTQLIQKYVLMEPEETAWENGFKCLVKCEVKGNTATWHRGCISKLSSEANVDLLDYGIKVTTNLKNLRKCPKEFATMNSTIVKARLDCSATQTWTDKDWKLLKGIVNSYNRLFVVFKDNNEVLLSEKFDEARPVVLWGKNDPSLCQNISRDLEREGLVVSSDDEKKTTKLDKRNWSFIDFAEAHRKQAKREIEKQKGASERNDLVEGSLIQVGEVCVTLKKSSVQKWKDEEPMSDMSFTAMPTNVDSQGNITLYNYAFETDLRLMSEIINHFFKGLPKVKGYFKVGDPCLVLFDNDALFYRGKIVELLSEKCTIEFIDYGNIQHHTPYSKVYSDVICWEVPPFAHKYRLCGSPKDENGQIDKKLLEILHQQAVDNVLHVKVMEEDVEVLDPNFAKRCWITLNGKLIKTYRDFAVYVKEHLV